VGYLIYRLCFRPKSPRSPRRADRELISNGDRHRHRAPSPDAARRGWTEPVEYTELRLMPPSSNEPPPARVHQVPINKPLGGKTEFGRGGRPSGSSPPTREPPRVLELQRIQQLRHEPADLSPSQSSESSVFTNDSQGRVIKRPKMKKKFGKEHDAKRSAASTEDFIYLKRTSIGDVVAEDDVEMEKLLTSTAAFTDYEKEPVGAMERRDKKLMSSNRPILKTKRKQSPVLGTVV